MYIRFFLGGGPKTGGVLRTPCTPPPAEVLRGIYWVTFLWLFVVYMIELSMQKKNSPNITQILFRNKIFKLVKVELGLQKDRLWHDKFLLYALQTNEMSSDLPPILLYEIHINMHSYQINLYYFVYNSI